MLANKSNFSIVPDNCVGHNFTHGMCRAYAMARIAVAIIDVIVDTAHGRDAVQHDANFSAPLIFDLHIFELRVDLEHAGENVLLDAGGIAARVIASATK